MMSQLLSQRAHTVDRAPGAQLGQVVIFSKNFIPGQRRGLLLVIDKIQAVQKSAMMSDFVTQSFKLNMQKIITIW